MDVFGGTAAYNFWTSLGGSSITVDFMLGRLSAADGSGAFTRCVRE